jgi:hypothetical protein
MHLLLTYLLASPQPSVALIVRPRQNRRLASLTSSSQEPMHTILDATDFIIQVPQHYMKESNGYPSKLHNIHVEPMLSSEEAGKCLELAVTYGRHKWQKPDEERHTNFPTCDFAVEEASNLAAYLGDIDFQNRIFRRLSQAYGLDMEDLMGFIDLFCVNYVAESGPLSGGQTMDRLGAHRDGSILSFTVLLTPPSQFEGGGTFFDALAELPPDSSPVLYPNGVVRPSAAGYAVLHSGKLLHGACLTREVIRKFV